MRRFCEDRVLFFFFSSSSFALDEEVFRGAAEVLVLAAVLFLLEETWERRGAGDVACLCGCLSTARRTCWALFLLGVLAVALDVLLVLLAVLRTSIPLLMADFSRSVKELGRGELVRGFV